VNILIKVPIFVKITKKSKKKIIKEIKEQQEEVNKIVEQVKSEKRTFLLKTLTPDNPQVKAKLQQYDITIKNLQKQSADMKGMIDTIQNSEEGSLYPIGQLDAVVEIKKGDNLDEKISDFKIIVNENRDIIEIIGD